jgi:uncharacterized protein with FMN-binding domain
MAQASSSKKVANSMVAVGAAAVMAVYAAGYAKTRSAADRFDAQSAGRRPASPDGRVQAAPATQPAPVNTSAVADTPRDERNKPPQVASLERQEQMSPAAASIQPPASSSPAPAPVAAPAEAAPVVVASVLPPVAAVAAPAQAAAPAPAVESAAKWKDGTYTGCGTCRHGDIQAQVVIEGGRIQGATIAQCLTRYDCNVIGRLPPEVAQRQSAEVDYVSGATQSANAFYYAVLDALSKAK